MIYASVTFSGNTVLMADIHLFTVHLRVTVEGVVHTELFEADPNLSYRFSWQRKNAYNQNVYGIVTARGKSFYQSTASVRFYLNVDWLFIYLQWPLVTSIMAVRRYFGMNKRQH